MVDSKTVTSQVQELQIIIHEMEAEGHKVGESFLVEAITRKLPPSWRDYRNYLKHKKKEISLQDLIVRLKIEADNRGVTKPKSEEAFVAEASKKRGHFNNNKNKKRKAPEKRPNNQKQSKKFNGQCWVCGKTGHAAKDCRDKKQNNSEAHMIENMDIDESNFSAIVSECNLIQNSAQWWLDTGATRHICSDKSIFSTYKKLDHEEKLYMGNSAISKVEGSGTVTLKFTSGKTVKLNDVLHVPDIRKNLISGSVLSKKGFKMVFESDKMVLSKAGIYIGRGYLCDGLFKANVAVIGNNNMYSDNAMNKKEVSYIVEHETLLWHDRLGHINFRKMKKLANLELIPKFQVDKNYKCETCVEAKMVKKPFNTIDRSTEPLGLVHTDLCDFKLLPIRGGKK